MQTACSLGLGKCSQFKFVEVQYFELNLLSVNADRLGRIAHFELLRLFGWKLMVGTAFDRKVCTFFQFKSNV
jgi:hypothetical protein